jgi:ribosome-binding protein aMBF1 (putative translation factor)
MFPNQYDVVNIGNPKLVKKSTVPVKRQSVQHGTKDVDPETNPIQNITNSLKNAIISVRTAKGFNQEQLAMHIQQHPKDIKMLEAGKISMKQAKQIALKIEKVFKVKIL